MPHITTTSASVATADSTYCKVVLCEGDASVAQVHHTAHGRELHIGTKKQTELTPRAFRTLIRTIVKTATAHRITHLACSFPPAAYPRLGVYTPQWMYETIAYNILLASYTFTAYKTEKEPPSRLARVLLCDAPPAASRHIRRGVIIARATNQARDIANTPALDMTPTLLARAARRIMKNTPVSVKVLDSSQIRKLKMGLLEAVGKGAADAPKFIILEYWGKGASGKAGGTRAGRERPVVFLGKGITYDTGGLNIKPAGAMHDMHLDMAGGAAVIGALRAVADLGLRQNVVGLIPAAENAVSQKSMRAGDIVRSLSGKTVEVMHTDAEGRMVLADALTYAARYQPRAVIDVATLTGAALVALGQHTSALMSKDERLRTTLVELGEETGNFVWPLPLWDEYQEHLKSARADIANISPAFLKYGGAIEGGTFLSYFAGAFPWAHIDIAPRMETIASDTLAKGASGEPVPLLVRFVGCKW